MKVFVLCNSDLLALPTVHYLKSNGFLAGIGIMQPSAGALTQAFTFNGINPSEIFLLQPGAWVADLKIALNETSPTTVWTLTFPYFIPEELLTIPEEGFINFHFGLLPKYKGNDPVFWQIRNMEKEGGLTIHLMNTHIDEGPVLIREPFPIMPGETYGMHCQKLGHFAAGLAERLIGLQKLHNYMSFGDESGEALFDKKPEHSDLTIDWDLQTADEIEWLVNATNPKYDGAATTINGMPIRLLEVSPADVQGEITAEPGSVIHADVVYGLIVACINKQFLRINIARIREGFVSGVRLFNLGITTGSRFK